MGEWGNGGLAWRFNKNSLLGSRPSFILSTNSFVSGSWCLLDHASRPYWSVRLRLCVQERLFQGLGL